MSASLASCYLRRLEASLLLFCEMMKPFAGRTVKGSLYGDPALRLCTSSSRSLFISVLHSVFFSL